MTKQTRSMLGLYLKILNEKTNKPKSTRFHNVWETGTVGRLLTKCQRISKMPFGGWKLKCQIITWYKSQLPHLGRIWFTHMREFSQAETALIRNGRPKLKEQFRSRSIQIRMYCTNVKVHSTKLLLYQCFQRFFQQGLYPRHLHLLPPLKKTLLLGSIAHISAGGSQALCCFEICRSCFPSIKQALRWTWDNWITHEN